MVFIEVLGSYDGFLRHFYGSCGSEEGFGVNALRSVLPNQKQGMSGEQLAAGLRAVNGAKKGMGMKAHR